MIEYPYCKSKGLTVRHVSGISMALITAESVESALRKLIAETKQLKDQVMQLKADISNIYDAQNG